jgi:uncharacterized protein (TIGR03790 family)
LNLGRHALWLAVMLGGVAVPALAQSPAPAPSTPVEIVTLGGPKPLTWIPIPRLAGRLRAADLGLVINTADPASVAVGEYYAAARGLKPEQVLRVSLPVRSTLDREEFDRLRRAIDEGFGRNIQALALAWTLPFAVECNSITGALALGVDSELCKQSCNPSRRSTYFNSTSFRPLTDHGFRPAMLLTARTVEQAKALIDRGVAADGSLLLRGRPPVHAMFLSTDDVARRVRMPLYPPAGLLRPVGVDVKLAPAAELKTTPRVLLAITGSARLDLEPAPDWVAGALADHLTSTGGELLTGGGQSTVLDWIASGVTASHGTVTEPCNHLQKFPHPQVVLGHYMQGATALEAYWKSVQWPQQSLFVGEPLAAPFARR